MYQRRPAPPIPTVQEALQKPEIVQWIREQMRDGMKVSEEVRKKVSGETRLF